VKQAWKTRRCRDDIQEVFWWRVDAHPKVQSLVRNFFGGKDHTRRESDEVVAVGAAIQARCWRAT